MNVCSNRSPSVQHERCFEFIQFSEIRYESWNKNADQALGLFGEITGGSERWQADVSGLAKDWFLGDLSSASGPSQPWEFSQIFGSQLELWVELIQIFSKCFESWLDFIHSCWKSELIRFDSKEVEHKSGKKEAWSTAFSFQILEKLFWAFTNQCWTASAASEPKRRM